MKSCWRECQTTEGRVVNLVVLYVVLYCCTVLSCTVVLSYKSIAVMDFMLSESFYSHSFM